MRYTVRHVTDQASPPAKDTWEAAHLRALLAAATDPLTKGRLTQNRLADLSGIDRSRVNGMLRAKAKITLTYAERMAPHLGVKRPETMLPPEEMKETPKAPLALLEALAKKLGDSIEKQTEMDAELRGLRSRVDKLEARRATARAVPKR